ncbi:group II truncated hemoglobin [Acidomonas methanolica]|uniref:group II truncated hemoglobin n=1 Tax=Acidomonas methanolica TaxID=437 RepID=UPI00211A0DF7|nr:group II truncated hemoglobin [Acidomonas methanolica]MCQ9155131.1 group II truncated hemoglobin [Acidomonas methanolica]
MTMLYDALGGEQKLRRFTRRFYELMDSLPEARACRAIHPADLGPAEEKLFEYLSGWFGGPPLFTDKYGPPMLRARHLPAPIGEEEAEGWLRCFRTAWGETIGRPEIAAIVFPRVSALAYHMINRASGESA